MSDTISFNTDCRYANNANDRLDEKTHYFKAGFDALALQVRERYYTSVQDFSQQLSNTIAERLSPNEAVDGDIDTIHTRLNESRGTAEHHALPPEQKEVKKLAKRILKAVKEPLEDALKKESDLKGNEYEDAIKKLDSMGMFAATKSLDIDESPVKANGKRRTASDVSAAAGASPEDADVEMDDADDGMNNEAIIPLNLASSKKGTPSANGNNKKKKKSTPSSSASSSSSSSNGRTTRNSASENPPTEPLSPPMSTDSGAHQTDTADVFANGGVAWYLSPFDPEGTTVHEERYTGRAVLRAMSEELSDMDEDTLTELAVNGVGETPKTGSKSAARTRAGAAVQDVAAATPVKGGSAVLQKKAKKRVRSNQWSRPRRIR